MSRRHPVGDVVATLMLCSLLASPAAAQQVNDLYHVRDAVSQTHVEYHKVTILKGKDVVLADLRSPAKVTYFYVTPVSDMVLKIFRDDESEPSVLTPLGDFFGALRGKTIDYQSSPMQIEHGCHVYFLPMPFSKRARFVLANDSDRDYSAEMAYGIDYEQDQQYAAEKSRLHCTWRRSNPVVGGAPPLDRVIKSSQSGTKNNIATRHAILMGRTMARKCEARHERAACAERRDCRKSQRACRAARRQSIDRKPCRWVSG